MQGRDQEGLRLMREAFASVERFADARMSHVMEGQLGALMVKTGARAEGLRRLRQAYEELEVMLGRDHSHVTDTAVALSRSLASGTPTPAELAEAERTSRHALDSRGRALGNDNPKVAEARCRLGLVLARGNGTEEAIALLEQSLPALARWGAADPTDLAEARPRLAQLLAARARASR
jgi:hypothetical protein